VTTPASSRPLGSLRGAGAADWRLAAAVAMALLVAVADALFAAVSGQLAQHPSAALVLALATLAFAQVSSDACGSILLSYSLGRTERRVRGRLVRAVVGQPLTVLEKQPVGELLDRVDADPADLTMMIRRVGWLTLTLALSAMAAWIVAGLTWWPAWVLFPLVGGTALILTRRLAPTVARLRVDEQTEWSAHAAQMEESLAASDDLRTSLGQAYVLRRYAEQASIVLSRVARTSAAAAAMSRRTALVVSVAMAGLVVVGAYLILTGSWHVAALVTLWMLVSGFVAQLTLLAEQVPQVQAGLGAVARIRSLLRAPQEPSGGSPAPRGAVPVELRKLDLGYGTTFRLDHLSVRIPAGHTCALIGHSGSGKSTVLKAIYREVESPAGTVFLGGADVTTVALDEVRATVGVITQQTEILSATLAENITVFAPVPAARVQGAVAELGLTSWVASLPHGLDTMLGEGGLTLSSGERQLVAFLRLLVRDVSVVLLDEATARMDPVTAQLVTDASQRLLTGRTGVVVAHRLATLRHCHDVVVLERGRMVQHGTWDDLTRQAGPLADLLMASEPAVDGPDPGAPTAENHRVAQDGAGPDNRSGTVGAVTLVRHTRSRQPAPLPPRTSPSLAQHVSRLIRCRPRWGLIPNLLWFAGSLLGAYGILTGWLWGQVVERLRTGGSPWSPIVLLSVGLISSPLLITVAVRGNPLWNAAADLRLRLGILRGQTDQRRLHRVSAGEATSRALDSDRLVAYAHRWVEIGIAVISVGLTGVVSRDALAAAVTGAVLVLSALVAGLGTPLTRTAAQAAGDRRARFGGSLSSALGAVRTVKLVGTTDALLARLRRADRERVAAALREQLLTILLGTVPALLAWSGVVTAWTLHLQGVWSLATALLVATAVGSFSWYGRTIAAAVTEAASARTWLRAATELAGRASLLGIPAGIDLLRGTAPPPPVTSRTPLQTLELRDFSAVHDNGAVGVDHLDLTIGSGMIVLVVGRVASGKSSFLAALAGLVAHEGEILWNGVLVEDPQVFLRPGQVSYVAQVPRVLSGSFADNVMLDHQRDLDRSLADAQLSFHVAGIGGSGASVGTRGSQLSGGQLQRLAVARALAADAELLIADDITSALDAQTEMTLWSALRERGRTVVGSTTRRIALSYADTVVVLEAGRLVAVGPWSRLQDRWGHLAD
jgi:ATP-binding cassette subfamily B protein